MKAQAVEFHEKSLRKGFKFGPRNKMSGNKYDTPLIVFVFHRLELWAASKR